MSTFATDMAQLRAKGIQCFGIGPATDLEGRAEGLRHAQRSGAPARERADPVRPLQLRGRHGSRRGRNSRPLHTGGSGSTAERAEKSILCELSDLRGKRGHRTAPPEPIPHACSRGARQSIFSAVRPVARREDDREAPAFRGGRVRRPGYRRLRGAAAGPAGATTAPAPGDRRSYANNPAPGTTTFPLAAPAGKDSSARTVAPPAPSTRGRSIRRPGSTAPRSTRRRARRSGIR